MNLLFFHLVSKETHEQLFESYCIGGGRAAGFSSAAELLEFVCSSSHVQGNLPTILNENDIDSLLHHIRKNPLKSDSIAKQKKNKKNKMSY